MKQILLFALIFVSAFAYSQTSSVSGRVYSKIQNEPLKKVSVYLILEDSLVDSTLTNKLGEYIFENVGKGTYSIKAITKKYIGTIVETVKVDKDEHVIQTVYLNKSIKHGETECIFK